MPVRPIAIHNRSIRRAMHTQNVVTVNHSLCSFMFGRYPVIINRDGSVSVAALKTPWPIDDAKFDAPYWDMPVPADQDGMLDVLHVCAHGMITDAAEYCVPGKYDAIETEAVYGVLHNVQAVADALISAPASPTSGQMAKSWFDVPDSTDIAPYRPHLGVIEPVRIGLQQLHDAVEDWLVAICSFRRLMNAGRPDRAAKMLAGITIAAKEVETILRELVPQCVGAHGPIAA